ncbi:hypothetical protein GGS21DRAFT_492161 [Xylaria nigripes]|nr:hypothetical protein GGS21DRAFT_492161 [Xylaria nigripes]
MDPKSKKIEEARSNLPLPEQPPVASDWNSADARNVNVGSGRVQSDVSTGAGSSSGLREPASKGDVDLSGVGRQASNRFSTLLIGPLLLQEVIAHVFIFRSRLINPNPLTERDGDRKP